MNRLACLAALRKTVRFGVLLWAAIALAAPLAFGGVDRWTTGGPMGRSVTSLAIDPVNPETVYAGTGREIFKSRDGGLSWTPSLVTPSGSEDLSALAIDPVSSSTVYAATNGGVFKSVDAGGSWAPVGPPVSNARAYSLVIDPLAPSTVYTGTADGLFKSTDGGARWSGRLLAATIYSLVFSPQTPSAIFGADYDGSFYYPTPSRVYRSYDQGATWSQSSTDLWIPPGALAIDPTNPTLYAGSHDNPLGTSGVYQSVDSGWTWRRIGPNSPGDVTDLIVDPQNPRTLYAATFRGVFRSTDGGVTWREFNTGFPNPPIIVASLAIDRTGTRLHAGTFGGGVFDYTVSGLSFHTVAPCRVTDTRDPAGPYGGPALVAGNTRVFTVAGQCGIPLSAKEVSLNVTVTAPTDQGHLRLYPGGTLLPLASAINYRPGQTRANNGIVPLGAGGDLAVFCGQSSGTTHFIIDVNGYFE